jgi:hypothetical protein
MKANPEDIYRHIGYLFYAISQQGAGSGSSKLVEKLNTFIDHNWRAAFIDNNWRTVLRGDKHLDEQLVAYMRTGIHDAFENSMNSHQAYEFFEEYYSLHHLLFGSSLSERILDFSNSLEEAFFRTRHESPIVLQLQNLLHINKVAS